MKSININNYEQTLWFSLIDHDCFCEYRIPRHVILWIESGHLRIEKNGETIVAEPGDFIFVRRDCAASMAKLSDGDIKYKSIAITFTREYLKDFYNRNQAFVNSSIRPTDKPFGGTATILNPTIELRSLFHSLVPYADEGEIPTPEMLVRKLDEAIFCLIGADRRLTPTLFDFRETWKVDLLEFMERNFTEDMSIEDFAAYSGRSLATFKRDFAKISNMSPQKWLNAHRLERARELVATGKSRPSDVYVAVGFRNRTHFISAFKQRFGCTPSSLTID